MTRMTSLALASLVLSTSAFAQVPVEIDLRPETTPLGSDPAGNPLRELDDLPFLNGAWIFSAWTAAHGRELWRTDGTTAGTQLLVDLNPGPADGVEAMGVGMGGHHYFIGDDGTTGGELYRTDGTAAGTGLVFEIGPGAWSGYIWDLEVAQRRVYVVGHGGTVSDLWMTDGTLAGSQPILRSTGGGFHEIQNLVPEPGGAGLYFGGHSMALGLEPHYTDGTSAVGTLLADIAPGVEWGGFGGAVAWNGKLLFKACGPSGCELYETDGTPAGTGLFVDLEPGPGSSNPSLHARGELGGLLYFSATTTATGSELFRTDGTVAGTSLALDAVPGPTGSGSYPLGVVNGQLALSADLGSIGYELYVLSGGSLQLLADLNPGPGDSLLYLAKPLGASLAIRTDEEPRQLILTDGTPAGTMVLPEGSLHDPGLPMAMVSPTTALIRGGQDGVGSELFLTDGTVAGTVLLGDIEAGSTPLSSAPYQLTSFDGEDLVVRTQFHASVQAPIFGLSAGQAPTLLGGLSPTELTLAAFEPVWLGQGQQVLAPVVDFGAVPYAGSFVVTDGTPAGTGPAFDVPGASWPAKILGGNGERALFTATSAAMPGVSDLWSTDGTTAGTQVVTGMSASTTIKASDAVRLGDHNYLTLPDGLYTFGLYRTDGTPSGTSLLRGGLKRIGFAWQGPTPDNGLVVVGDRLYFTASDGTHGVELWTSDGTVAGTHQVVDLNPGASHAAPFGLMEFGGVLHFFAHSAPLDPWQLWRSDGTAAGTTLAAAVESDDSRQRVVAGDWLYFEGYESATGWELWTFDGSVAQRLTDIDPGPEHAGIYELIALGDRAYFTADDPAAGRELFLADAAAGAAGLVHDLFPGPSGSEPADLTLCGGSLYFVATGPDGDRELWKYDVPEAHAIELPFGGSGASLSATPPALGSTLLLTVEGAPAGALGVLAMGAPVADPLGAFVEGGNALWVDPFAFTVLAASTTANWTYTQPIPNAPALAGAQVNVQAWFLPPALLPATTSNGLRLVLGS